MTIQGGCYCKAVRYEATGEPRFKGQCFCRECQYIAGGNSNIFMIMPADSFTYTKGTPKKFSRKDLPAPATREFCLECGTHLTTRTARDPSIVILKVGTLDDPSIYGSPQAILYTSEMQKFHVHPEGARTFPKFPG
jgi:hypothetical protein